MDIFFALSGLALCIFALLCGIALIKRAEHKPVSHTHNHFND